MKTVKRKAVIGWFLAGTVLLSTAAAADVIIGNGYNGAKDALKYTAQTLTQDSSSFTVNADMEITADGESVWLRSLTSKYDLPGHKCTELSSTKSRDIEENGEFYSYNDKYKNIVKGTSDDKYYQTNYSDEYVNSTDIPLLSNPFDEEETRDLEKVADAIVNSMKDFVQISDTENGGKMYFGNLENEQIPSVANAVATLAVKYGIFDEYTRDRYGLPEISENFYVSSVDGKVSTTAEGLIENFAGNIVLKGTDKSGADHEVVFSLSGNICDVGSTVVEEPNVSADEIVVNDNADEYSNLRLNEKDAAVYKRDIIRIENNSYVKTGEAVLTLDSASRDAAKGNLVITENGSTVCDIQIDAKEIGDWSDYAFEYTEDGQTKNGILIKNFTDNGYIISGIELYLDVYDLDTENGSWSQKDGSLNCFSLIRAFD